MDPVLLQFLRVHLELYCLSQTKMPSVHQIPVQMPSVHQIPVQIASLHLSSIKHQKMPYSSTIISAT